MSLRRSLVAGPALAALAVLLACGGDGATTPGAPAGPAPIDPAAPASRAFGIWRPSGTDTCTQEQHDAYAVIGPDGKKYPTWHPPTGPGGCSFGHEHGEDPRRSNLYRLVGDMPFGVANEALAISDPANPRDEDHVGHKVEYGNNVEVRFVESEGTGFITRCDVLAKLHMGTHSRDAFTNNVHELVYHLKCGEGSELHITMLAAIGNPGEFVRSCDRTTVIRSGVPAVPANSPRGQGVRLIPDRTCIERHGFTPSTHLIDRFPQLHEAWELRSAITKPDGDFIAWFNPYFDVRNPSRFYDPGAPNNVGRPIDVCTESRTDGRQVALAWCDAVLQTSNRAYDHPHSPYRGDDHFVDFNRNQIKNAGGPRVWYTDAYGRFAQREPFPGSLKQEIAPINNVLGAGDGLFVGDNGPNGGFGTRAPN